MSTERQYSFLYEEGPATSKGTLYNIHSHKTALNEWIQEVGAEAVHQELIIQNLTTLSECKKGSKQYLEIMAWIEAPIIYNNEPFTFATCCKAIGIDDAEIMREEFYSTWNKLHP